MDNRLLPLPVFLPTARMGGLGRVTDVAGADVRVGAHTGWRDLSAAVGVTSRFVR